MKTVSYINGIPQALSQDFINAWEKNLGKGGKIQVQAKRRYWNGVAFVYEANWQVFTMGDFVEVGQIVWKLDTPLMDEFKTSSVPLRFKGSLYQMLPSFVGTGGFFAPDNIATIGYEPFLTQFQIQFGYRIPSGDFEMVNLFTGVGIDYLYDVQGGYTEVTVSGNEAYLQYSDAQTVSTPISHLTTGTAMNTGTNQFTTNLPDIAFITAVYDNGVLKTQGTHYTISGTSQHGVGAVIQLTYTAAGAITYDGSQWLTFKKLEDLVTLLAQSAGLTSYNINPVVYPGYPISSPTYIGQFTGSAWTDAWAAIHNAPAFSGLAGVLTSNAIYFSSAGTASSYVYGIWEWRMSGTAYGRTSIHNSGAFIYFIADGNTDDIMSTVNGYYLNIAYGPLMSDPAICYLYRANAGAYDTLIASGPAPVGMSGGFLDDHTWTVTRQSNGLFDIYVDGLKVLSGTDNTLITSNYFNIRVQPITGAWQILNIGQITYSSGLQLTMADFTGMTCYDAIQQITKLANYEFLFDADGVLNFRSKTPANLTPVINIDQSDGISKILDFRLGYADIKNVAQVTYEENFVQFDSTTAPAETAPTSEQRYLQQIESEDYTGFLLAYDPQIAYSRARSLHDTQYRARRRCRLGTKITPQVDLSDVMTFSFYNNPRMAGNIWGDPLEKWGGSAFGLPSNVLARNLNAKIIGMILDPYNCVGEIEVQEILP